MRFQFLSIFNYDFLSDCLITNAWHYVICSIVKQCLSVVCMRLISLFPFNNEIVSFLMHYFKQITKKRGTKIQNKASWSSINKHCRCLFLAFVLVAIETFSLILLIKGCNFWPILISNEQWGFVSRPYVLWQRSSGLFLWSFPKT